MTDDEDTTDCIQVTLTRSPLHGFGLTINGGNDDAENQSLIITDVIKSGPADGKLLPNDRIVNVNGHPVVRFMEHTALKLIYESTDFVNLIVQRQKHSVTRINHELPIKCVLNKTRKDEKFSIILDCRYFIKKIYMKNNEIRANIQENDEVIKINDIPVDRLTLQEAQKLIEKAKDQLTLHIRPHRIQHQYQHQDISSSYKQLHADYSQHIFEPLANNHHNVIRPGNGTRYVSFFTDTSSMGIRLAGGNKYGLFICEIQTNSIAYRSGLFVGDKIFSVNNVDFTNLTREEAVLCLMNLKTSQVNMIVSNIQDEYEHLLGDVGGDSFYIRSHFSYHSSNVEEISICINDIFHVTDTLYNGQVGYWVATKLSQFSADFKRTGAIPNQSRAEQLVESAVSLEDLIRTKQSTLKRRIRTRFLDRRAKSVLSLNHFKEDPTFSKVNCWKPMINSKFSAYERVKLKSITIIRPVVLLGPLADIARDRLLEQYPDQFELPETFMDSTVKTRANIIKLQSIKNVIQKNHHCLLDITPSAIEQLNYAECYPIVIYFKCPNRRIIKQIRHEYGKLYQKSSRRLFEHAEYMEYFYSYLFTCIIQIDTAVDWFETLRSQIEIQQDAPLWMSNDRCMEKDFLKSDEYFISTRSSNSDDYSYQDQSSPDLITKHPLQRVASDPLVFKKENIFNTYMTDLYHNHNHDEEELSRCIPTPGLSVAHHGFYDVSTVDNGQGQYESDLTLFSSNSLHNQRSFSKPKAYRPKDPSLTTNRTNTNRTLTLNQFEKMYLENESKLMSLNSLSKKISTNQNSSRPLLTSPKVPEKIFIDRNGSTKKSLIDKSTMTMINRNSTMRTYETWNGSATTHSRVLVNNQNNALELVNGIPTDSSTHDKQLQPSNPNEQLPSETLYSNKKNYTKLNVPTVPLDHAKPQILSTSSIQKPRVYTADDRTLPSQQQVILSSSSESSTSSLKDKSIKEVGETRSYSIQDGPNVIGSARGIMDYYGGKLSCPLTGVSLFIPMGAIPEGIQQEIYFQVHQDTSHTEKFHGQLLSPIVICGPHGIQFKKPVELIIPHSAGNDAQQLSLMLHGINQNSKLNNQLQTKSPSTNGINHITNSNVSVLIDHF